MGLACLDQKAGESSSTFSEEIDSNSTSVISPNMPIPSREGSTHQSVDPLESYSMKGEEILTSWEELESFAKDIVSIKIPTSPREKSIQGSIDPSVIGNIGENIDGIG